MGESHSYIRWTRADIEELPFAKLLTEISPVGVVLRELGLNGDHEIVHRAPTVTNRGMFDNQVVSLATLGPTSQFSTSSGSGVPKLVPRSS
jgi:hypothetical protein